MLDSDYLGSVYYFMWAQSCAFPSTIQTKETLINLFETIRIKDLDEVKIQSETGDLRFKTVDTVNEKSFFDFILCFFRTQNIMFTRIGEDQLEALYKR